MRNRKLLNKIMIVVSVLIIASMVGSVFIYVATQSATPVQQTTTNPSVPVSPQ